MAQHDYDIANQTAPNFRSDLNDALEAIATNNSGSTQPSATYANQWWYDTSNNILKIRSEADDAWINVGYLDQSTNEFKPYIGATQITAFLDEDDMSSDSPTAIPSQQSVKAYVDAASPDTGLYTKTADVATTSGTTIAITGLDPDKSYLLFLDNVQCDTSSDRELEIRFSSNNGSSYSGDTVISTDTNFFNGARGQLTLLKPVGLFSASVLAGPGFSNDGYFPLSRPTGMSASVNAVRLEWSGGASFDGGNVEVIEIS